MDADRLNPVILISGAASGFGNGCARTLAGRASGGFILIDYDETSLADAADALGARGNMPERVSTLAFDVGDEDRWTQAESFLRSQYGRLDWAILTASAAPSQSELVEWGRPRHLEAIYFSLRAVMRLMQENVAGGAIIVSAPAGELKAAPNSNASLLHLVRAAAKEAAHDNIRINALLTGGGPDTPRWNTLPHLRDLAPSAGGYAAAFDHIAHTADPIARYAAEDDVRRLIAMLLSDDTHASGAAVIVDGGYTL